jgi:hypothetical protein
MWPAGIVEPELLTNVKVARVAPRLCVTATGTSRSVGAAHSPIEKPSSISIASDRRISKTIRVCIASKVM